MNRPRPAAAPQSHVWRLTVGWALSCALIAGGVSAVVFGHRQPQVNIAQVRLPEQPSLAIAQVTKQELKHKRPLAQQEDEDLLALVDSDVSRAVPSAMEPLAQLMVTDESK